MALRPRPFRPPHLAVSAHTCGCGSGVRGVQARHAAEYPHATENGLPPAQPCRGGDALSEGGLPRRPKGVGWRCRGDLQLAVGSGCHSWAPGNRLSPCLSSAYSRVASGSGTRGFSSPSGKRLPLSRLFHWPSVRSVLVPDLATGMLGSDWPGLGHVPAPVMGERTGLCKSQVLRELGEEATQEKSGGCSREPDRPRPAHPPHRLGGGGSDRPQAVFFSCDEKSGANLSSGYTKCSVSAC